MRAIILGLATAALIVACTAGSAQPSDPFVGFGPNPDLPAPKTSPIPTIGVPKVVGWARGARPKAPDGFTVTRFAEGLDHPRWLLVLPNGDVLVAQASSAPPADPDAKPQTGLRAMVARWMMKRAGAGGPSPNSILLLRDADGDGMAELKTEFATGLTRPFGMALVGETLYVANDNGVVRFAYKSGQTKAEAAGEPVFDLPSKPLNHHWTKSLIASPDGARLYATVGSNSNIGENGMAAEEGRAAIHEYVIATGQRRIFASGLRNPNGLAWEPVTGALWTTVNERDELGNDLVPDYMTSVRDGGFYGWPYSYFGRNVDDRIQPPRPDLVAKAIAPDYALGPHTASLGLAFYTADAFPAAYRGGAFIGQHGSWNRKPLNGYRVVFVPFKDGKPSSPPQVFLDGFLKDQKSAQGRPVGVAVDARGGLLVADDAGAIVWRVAPSR
jgi:glucose/arabinose dehydrogenase